MKPAPFSYTIPLCYREETKYQTLSSENCNLSGFQVRRLNGLAIQANFSHFQLDQEGKLAPRQAGEFQVTWYGRDGAVLIERLAPDKVVYSFRHTDGVPPEQTPWVYNNLCEVQVADPQDKVIPAAPALTRPGLSKRVVPLGDSKVAFCFGPHSHDCAVVAIHESTGSTDADRSEAVGVMLKNYPRLLNSIEDLLKSATTTFSNPLSATVDGRALGEVINALRASGWGLETPLTKATTGA